MTERPFSLSNILCCIALSRGEGPRSIVDNIPLVAFMSGENPILFMARPDRLVIWLAVCGWELEKQFAHVVQAIEWPDWEADYATLSAWYEEQVRTFGETQMVRPMPEGFDIDQLDFESTLKLDGITPGLFSRLGI